ncbi:50S ribosomal protein L28 [Candidatus Uhrbacteria bacterium]|nr:50S ribosomal protein L28 [Candidatus Uhrbacteria bacterium]
MSRTCEITGRGPKSSVSRSHSKVQTKRRNKINLQPATTVDGKKIKIAARTLKTLKKKGLVK